mmetsp:Transcript_88243/g.189395  ORF Transcript_88243/g.189395 Transcript_88243/m.189395 type:complete len:391 (-) Transcript_88243:87-1259(-)
MAAVTRALVALLLAGAAASRARAIAGVKGLAAQAFSDAAGDCEGAKGCPDHSLLSLLQMQAQRQARAPRSRVAEPLLTPVVWITSFARSGSSTLLSLVEAEMVPVFALFEPCHEGDQLDPWLAQGGCAALLSQLAQCNFTGVNKLWGWFDSHSLTNGADHNYSPYSATKACKAAELIVFKTISWGHNLTGEVIPFLEDNPQVKAINLVRDPRSIFASMLSTDGAFQETQEWRESDGVGLLKICNYMGANIHVSHPRLFEVVYESLVDKPILEAKHMFKFLGAPDVAGRQSVLKFVRTHFNSPLCEDDNDSYSDCRSNSTERKDRFTDLTNDEYASFMASESCRSVANFYNYDLWYYRAHSGRSAPGSLPFLFTLVGLVGLFVAPVEVDCT